MKKLAFSFLAILCSIGLFAQIPANFTATDCNNITQSIHAKIGATGKSVIVMSKGVDCSACRSTAASWQSWASQNTVDVEVWAAMTYRYDPRLFNNPCNAVNAWVSQYSWNDVYAFPDNNRDFLGPAMPRYYVYSAVDSSLIYNGSSSATARSLALQNSVVGVEELEALKTVKFSIQGRQLLIKKEDGESFQMRMLDLNGRTVKSKTVSQANTFVDLGSVSKGIYIINMLDGSNSLSKKIFVP